MNFRRLFLSIILFLFCAAAASAQRVVSGTVTDSASNAPLASVTVLVKGTGTGTQTGADGRFTITVPANATTLVVSSVGYGTKEITAGTESLNISLAPTSTVLTDVVVIGYGTVKKKDLTGSIATVGEKDFQKGVITTPEQLIAGKVAGVSIISNNGQPGSGSTIRIRGGSSLSASNDPLIVIDGVPLDNDRIAGAGNPLSFINANDVESFTVLKDASAAAIYGTRASNGVIIITTKKGKAGALKVNFSTVNSLSEVTDQVSVLNATQFRDVVNQHGTAPQIATMGSENTNWQSLIYQTAFTTNNNISLTGGIKALPYRLSIGYLNQAGVLKTDKLEKTSLAFVLNPTLFDNHLKIDLNLKGSVENTRFGNQGAIGSAIAFDPTQPVYSGDKRFNGYYVGFDQSGNPVANPVALINDYHDNSKAQRSIGNAQFDYKFHFLPDLHANLNLGYDISKGTGTRYASDSAAQYYTRHGINDQYKQTKTNTLLEFYLNYTKDIASIKSHVDVLAGYSYNNYLTKIYNYADLNARGDTITKPQYPFDEPEHTLISFFGRVNYFYNDKYLLTATLRRDGSSRFSPSNRWGLFPSVALAWSVSNEDFLKNSDVVSNLKLRLGYGETGQQDGIGNYDYLSYYSKSATSSSYQFGDTYYQGFRPGGFYANRKWEQTATTNVGIDYGFLHNRISGSIDYYLKKTSDLLNNIPQPAGTNFSAFIVANVGNMKNEGVEFNLNTQPVKNNDLTWDVNFNFTYNKNTITNLTVIPNDPTYIGFPSTNISGSQGFAFINSVGESKNTFYLYHQVYDKSGIPVEGLFEDVNRDGIINEDDKYKGQRADPNVFLGFSTNVSYKNWNIGFVLRASFNNYVYNNIYSNNGRLNQVIGGPVLYNVSTNYLTTQFEGTTDQQLLSDYYIENASFLKLDNFNIGYNVGKIFNNKASLSLNGTIQNLFVITEYSGLDPEISNGVDNNFYPRPRIYALGLNLNF
jgi:TonB-linked SusC/RagA family outer membrane protein